MRTVVLSTSAVRRRGAAARTLVIAVVRLDSTSTEFAIPSRLMRSRNFVISRAVGVTLRSITARAPAPFTSLSTS